MSIAYVGLDLAKNVFQVHCSDNNGRVLLRKRLPRLQLLEFFANLPACTVAMEACATAHYWGRKFERFGHAIRLIAPQFVKPFVKSNKNDSADAEAICEAVQRPTMRFVPLKSVEQQAILAIHRARDGFVKARTAQANQLRGLLAEFGVTIPVTIRALYKGVVEAIARESDDLPVTMKELCQALLQRLREIDEQISALEVTIVRWHRQSELSKMLETIPGIGPISATAIVGNIGDGRCFKNGRQFAAWLGLVPRQYSSGGAERLLGISKRGDAYLRRLLVHGARVLVRWAINRGKPEAWLTKVTLRRNPNIAAIAMANKNARIAWALLHHAQKFERNHVVATAS